jgi:hypothetical protein
MQFLHHIFECDEVLDVEIGFIGECIGSRIEVDVLESSISRASSCAASLLTKHDRLLFWRQLIRDAQNVDLPAPAGPITVTPYPGISNV